MNRTVIMLVVGTVAALAVTVVAALLLTGGTSLRDVGATCDVPEAPEIVAVLDDGDSLAVSGAGATDAATKATKCVLDELDAPDSFRAKILDTAPIDGRQEEAFGDWQVSWTYQPNAGLNLIVEKG